MNEYMGEVVGDDIEGDDEVLGAVSRARKPRLSAPNARAQRLRGYLGLGELTFNSTTGAGVQKMTVEPQRGFRPERLVISRRDGSTATASISARIDNIFIGDLPQSPSQEQPAPTEMFAADATVSGVDFDVCKPGMKIQVSCSTSSAPTGTEFVKLTAGFYGDMLRGA